MAPDWQDVDEEKLMSIPIARTGNLKDADNIQDAIYLNNDLIDVDENILLNLPRVSDNYDSNGLLSSLHINSKFNSGDNENKLLD